MKKVIVNGKIGFTTSVIPHRSGKFPVWFEDAKRCPSFVDSKFVFFI